MVHDFSVVDVVICVLFSCIMYPKSYLLGVAVLHFFSKFIFRVCFACFLQYLQMKWPLLDVQAGTLQSRQALKDARSPSPAHIVVSDLTKAVASFTGGQMKQTFFC